MAHIGALAILLASASCRAAAGTSPSTPCAARTSRRLGRERVPPRALGFGAKAGLVPLHVWLPEAHPAAPSPVSALMSGVMLKTAVYGMLRVTFDLLGHPVWWWGLVPLAAGLLTALYGVVFAAVQTDMKRLLAYSSIEKWGCSSPASVSRCVLRRRDASTGGARTACDALSFPQSRGHEEPALPGYGSVLHATGQRNLAVSAG